MAIQSKSISQFYGGMSDSEATGLSTSANLIKSLNVHEDQTYVTFHPKPSKVSGLIVTDLIKWAVDANPFATDRYFAGDTGTVYKETSGGTWSLDHTVSAANPGNGQGLFVFNDYLYLTSPDALIRKGRLSSTSPAYSASDDMITTELSLNADQSNTTASGQTYTTPAAINEAATHKFSFTPTKDPIGIIGITLTAKGTGSLVLTVHDANNNLISTYTTTNANLVVGVNNIYFYSSFVSTPARVITGQTYHVHVTMSTADATVQTSTTADLSTAWYKEYYAPLVADANFHPMIDNSGTPGQLVIGNEHYLAVWDDLAQTYDPNKIVLDPGFKVRSLSKENELIVAAAWKGPNIDSVTEGRLYYWDGISPSVTYSKPITVGLPNAITNFKNRTLSVLGSSGALYLGTDPFQKVYNLPNLARGKKIEVFPGAITQWGGRAMIGYSASTDDASFQQGVYGFGNRTEAFPEVITYDFIISTGTTTGTTLKIGMVQSFGKDLYIGWRDGSSYGVDKVSKTDNPQISGSWQSLIDDLGDPQKTDLALKLVITFAPLASGESVTPKYRLDRATNFTLGTAVTTVNAVRAEQVINSRCREIEFGFDLATGTTFPKVTSVYLQWDDLKDETDEK